MGCKAHSEAKYRSNLMVVRILVNCVTRQTAFYSPRSINSKSRSTASASGTCLRTASLR